MSAWGSSSKLSNVVIFFPPQCILLLPGAIYQCGQDKCCRVPARHAAILVGRRTVCEVGNSFDDTPNRGFAGGRGRQQADPFHLSSGYPSIAAWDPFDQFVPKDRAVN